MEIENVFSAFNGMGCGYEALTRAGIKFKNYYASEVDKYANQFVSQNYPDTIQLGDVRHINVNDLPKIDLLIGGSPCQDFSFAGKRNGATTECKIEITTLEQYLKLKQEGFAFKGQSYLFWEFVRLLKEMRKKNPNIKFMLENVQMTEKWKHIINAALGVESICINSALVSAQNRVRLYWRNWHVEQPEDMGIYLKDILQPENEIDSKYYLTEKQISNIDLTKLGEYIEKDIKILGHRKGYRRNLQVYDIKGKTECLDTCTGGGRHPHALIKMSKKGTIKNKQDKSSCITGGGHSGGNHSDMDLLCVAQRGRYNAENKIIQTIEPRKDGKTNCLTTVQKDNYIFVFSFNGEWWAIRRLTPIEAARLQTFYDDIDMTGISDSQLYKMFGNGWNIETIVNIFIGLKNCEFTANITAEPAQGKLL